MENFCFYFLINILCLCTLIGSGAAQKISPNIFWEGKCVEYYANKEKTDLRFPFMAHLGFGEKGKEEWICGGTLISKKHILTAAQCLLPRMGPAKWARLGTTNFKTADPTHIQQFDIISRIPHPAYEPSKVYHDIGVAILEKSVTLNQYVRPVCLQLLSDINKAEPFATGWGLTTFAGEASEELKTIKLKTASNDVCQKAYDDAKRKVPNGIDNKIQICYSPAVDGVDTCQGDSGGPVVFRLSDEEAYTQIGITSFGKGCGIPNIPGVYTRVTYYLPWLQAIVAEE